VAGDEREQRLEVERLRQAVVAADLPAPPVGVLAAVICGRPWQ
jgi:hypothetical protein